MLNTILFNKIDQPQVFLLFFLLKLVTFFFCSVGHDEVNLYYAIYIFYEHYHLHNKYVIASIWLKYRYVHDFYGVNFHNIRSYMQFSFAIVIMYVPFILRSIINKSIKIMHMFVLIGWYGATYCHTRWQRYARVCP